MPHETAVEAKAFQGKPSSRTVAAEDDKENVAPPLDAQNPTTKDRPFNKEHVSSSPSKAFPSTPATRLPLLDLIGDTEQDLSNRAVRVESPGERIRWQAALSPRSPNSKTTPAARNKRRHHSSSPPTTSQQSANKRICAESVPYDLERLKASLKRPQIDPSTALWKRYATGTERAGEHSIQAPGLSLAVSSSPHLAEEQAGNVSGLRRWTSCGVEFPTSNAKRQKLSLPLGEARVAQQVFDGPAAIKERASPIVEPSTRKGNILERVQSVLQHRRTSGSESHAPSSSSPLPDRQEDFDRQSISPCRASELAARNTGKASRSPIYESNRKVQEFYQKRGASAASSSFGSNTLGSDIMEAAIKREDEAVGRPDVKAKPEQGYPSQTLHEHPSELQDEDYGSELGDAEFVDDLDLSAEGLGDVAAAGPNSPPAASGIPSGLLPDEPELFAAGDADYGGNEEDEVDEELFAAAELSATQTASGSVRARPSSRRRKRAIQRYLVKQVQLSQYTSSQGRKCPEKIVHVQEEAQVAKALKTITLRGSWLDTRCTEGSYVHVIGAFTKSGRCIINDAQNMLILHPDHLISALVVADSFGCMRKAVLQGRIKATNAASPPMLYGTVLHEIFQEAIQANRWDDEWLCELIESIVKRHIEDVYQTGLTVDTTIQHLQSKIRELQAWAEIFIKAKPEGPPRLKDMHGKRVKMSVNKLLDVEEHIWSPMYGLKGNIDATVQVLVDDGDVERTLTVPLELKTGKQESASHRAQTALYTLLLSDRYDVDVAYGILYYMERSETLRIPAIRHEIRHMVMQRNELACYVRERLSLPPMIRNTYTCNRCYAKVPCFLYHKMIEDGDGETSGLREKFVALTKHLQPQHQAFFKKWDELLTWEESEMMKFRRELWTMLSHEREKLGRCFANVRLRSDISNDEPGTSKINRFSYRFCKMHENTAFSFAESQIAAGEPIVISDELGHYALAKGYVTALSKTSIDVAVDRRLHNARTRQLGFDAENNQTFAGIMDISTSNGPQSPTSTHNQPTLYRLDKDEYSNGMATVRNNLIELMTADVFHSHDLRSLIVDLAPPRFRTTSSAIAITGPPSQSTINADQQNAIEKIMAAQDYALVLGMPGTGKTTTIAHIIRALVAKGKSVLLTSYTHTAVDNILLKIQHDSISVLRLGALARIHPDVKNFATLAAEQRSTVEELQSAYHDPSVVATTCLGISHPLFSQRTFDYCIVDEASQITLPVCLGPIRMARTFVLVGDHFQLPPLVQNREALKGGLDVSLFKLLCEARPEAVATLSRQYRMNEGIMRLANQLIYDNRLVCGSAEIASRRLELPFRSGSRITNPLEARLVTSLTHSLLLCGTAPSQIGIITLYRSQLALIKTHLSTSFNNFPEAKEVEAHTADRFQGRDKDVVIVSFVRGNEQGEVGELLRDWRRVNVSITRARRKLVLVGSRRTLEGDGLLGRLLGLCDDVAGGMVDLAEEWGHDFSRVGGPDDVHGGNVRVVEKTTSHSSTKPIMAATLHPDHTQQHSQRQQARRPLAPLSSNLSSTYKTSPTEQTKSVSYSNTNNTTKNKNKNKNNPPYKAPTRIIQGQAQKPMRAAMKKTVVLQDVMADLMGDEFDDFKD